MTDTHTPGPWLVDNGAKVYCDDATGSIIAQCDGFEYAPRPSGEAEANARLIAAAPEMLAALERVSKEFTGPLPDKWHFLESAISDAERVVAKAKGT